MIQTFLMSLVTVLVLTSCGLTKDGKNKEVRVTATFQEKTPYCGGAKPSPEQEKGYVTPYANQVFYFQKEGSDKKTKVLTSESGLVSLQLSPGNYNIFKADKVELEYDAFYAKYKSNSKIKKESPSPCFEDWYKRADFTLNLVNDTLVNYKTLNRCYIGYNPCITYVGPLAP